MRIVPLSSPLVCCAELNAIVSAFRYHADLTNSTLYTTGVPCPKCAQMIVQSGIKTVVYGGENEIEKSADKNLIEKAAKLMEAAGTMKVEDARNTTEVLENVAGVVEKAAEVLNKSDGEIEEAAGGMEEAVKIMKGYVEKMKQVAKDIETDLDQGKREMKKFVDEMEEEIKKEAEEEGKLKKILAGLARFIFDHIVNRGTEEDAEGEAEKNRKDKVMEIQKAFQKAAKIMVADAEKMKTGLDAKKMAKEAEEIFYWAKVATL